MSAGTGEGGVVGRWLMIAALCALLAGTLAGCGQKGSLYLPDDPAASEEDDYEIGEEDA